MTETEAKKLVAVIVAAYPSQAARLDRERAAGMVEAFSTLLEDLAYEDVNRALRVLLQTRTFMPSIAEIREAVLEMRHGARRVGGEAWGSVLRAMREQGAYRAPGRDFQFSDPTTARAVSLMGWADLCTSENSVADRARFIELYDQLATTTRREMQSPVLAEARRFRELGERSGSTQVGGALAKVFRITDGGES